MNFENYLDFSATHAGTERLMRSKVAPTAERLAGREFWVCRQGNDFCVRRLFQCCLIQSYIRTAVPLPLEACEVPEPNCSIIYFSIPARLGPLSARPPGRFKIIQQSFYEDPQVCRPGFPRK